MPFVLPFRTKNPPDRFPYCTVAIIAINFLVYFLTTKDLVVTDSWLHRLAVSHNTLSLWRLITSLFLHANPLHILGNMLFLWLFGPAVEGRLRPGKFLLIYFAAGILGGLFSDFIVGPGAPNVYSLGASGAIMGVLGAYLYMFPFSQVLVFWILFIRIGIAQWQAVWLIALFVAMDVLNGVILRAADGVGHVAHLSGFALGYVAALAFRPHTDSHRSSQVKSLLAEHKDIRLLTPRELGVLARQPGADSATILTYCQRAYLDVIDHHGRQSALEMLSLHGRRLIDEADPAGLARFLLMLGPGEVDLPSLHLIRLGSRLEQASDFDSACLVYRRVYDCAPKSRDSEAALYRLGRLLETHYDNPLAARETYLAMLRLFPNGGMAHDGQSALARTSQRLQFPPSPDAVYTPGPELQDMVQLVPQDSSAPGYHGSGRTIEF